MASPHAVTLKPPYLILIGEGEDRTNAKTGFGIVQWRRELVAGQLRFPGCSVDLGVPDLSIAEAAAAGVGSLVVGVAPVGGAVPEEWFEVMAEAARAGLDIVCGLHLKLADHPGVVAAASASGARLIDVRVPPRGLRRWPPGASAAGGGCSRSARIAPSARSGRRWRWSRPCWKPASAPPSGRPARPGS